MTTPPSAEGGAAAAGFLAHGMGKTLVEPDWPPLTGDEVSAVLARYELPCAPAVLRWHSPRPMSAAAIVGCGGAGGFIKRHHRLVPPPRPLAPPARPPALPR